MWSGDSIITLWYAFRRIKWNISSALRVRPEKVSKEYLVHIRPVQVVSFGFGMIVRTHNNISDNILILYKSGWQNKEEKAYFTVHVIHG